jgi:monoamine oxidase
LGCGVEEVRWSPEGVRVAARQHDDLVEFEARRAIVTVPLGVLKANKIRFQPPLPESKQQAITRLGMGQGILTLLTFKEPFWRQSRKGLRGIATDLSSQAWWDPYEHAGDAAALKGYVAGREGARLSSRSTEEIIEFGLRDLHRLFPKVDIRPQLLRFDVANWPADPYCLGLYSYCTPGSMGLRQHLADTLSGVLYWAGEATLISSVDYAFESGRREARRILSDLRA